MYTYKPERCRVPIKVWSEKGSIEQGALDQIENIASLPFAFHHIVLAPDGHQGYGMPIGGVLATEGVVIPNAVGVDVGCFTGGTKVPLLNGTQRTLKELTDNGKDIYVYSLDDKLRLVAGKATPKLTRRNAELVEVVISGGEIIECTPDHRFMLLDGSYKEAKDLKPFDSLMPLHRSYQSRDGYERIETIAGNGVITHQMVALQFFGKRKETDLVHHEDGNWYNNNPDNLRYKNTNLHSKEHGKQNPTFSTTEFKKKRLQKLRENGFYDEKFREKKQEIARQNLKGYNKSNEKREQDKLAGKRGRKYLIKYNKSKKGRKKSSEIGKKYGFGRTNHKVLYVNFLNKRGNVYCLTVEKHHNFALSAGVFVHNCGMCAVKTYLKDITIDDLKKVMGKIREVVPVGFSHHSKKQDEKFLKKAIKTEYPIVSQEYESALKQIGTLGGGNHFIEIQKGSDGYIWVMLHSGSRNIGYTTANYYNKVAKKLNEKWYTSVDPKWDLAFLPLDSDESQSYLREMNYCVEFALANRKLMMDRIINIFHEVFDWGGSVNSHDDMINIAHNYAIMENHFGKNVMVHRKGATLAREGTIGIIPGSQGTKSYIVKGKGNIESFMSCSHGAGRAMGRKDARRRLNLEEEKKKMDDQGIVHGLRNQDDLDEASSAYKDIEIVMKNQEDLVEILVELTPLGVIKG